MSLTIYKSKFVLVGGCHSYTLKPTNIVLTSSTGQQWEPSLPPMPTKRYRTSSVSTRSPEVLVVAGGVGSSVKSLDVVEVLKDDKWIEVNSLSMPDSRMCSTLHDENFYFKKRDTMDTCSCASLISSCEKSSSNTSNNQLWKELRAPGKGCAIISHSSRLISIDHHRRVECYSSTHNSWIEATSKENGPLFNSRSIAACVFPTGDIVYFHDDGIYRMTVSGEYMCAHV